MIAKFRRRSISGCGALKEDEVVSSVAALEHDVNGFDILLDPSVKAEEDLLQASSVKRTKP